MAQHIFFVTTNTGKYEEVQRWVHQLDPSIILEQAAIDLPEHQSLDVTQVALGKAQEAWSLLQKPLLIDDGGIYLEQYNQFPGTLSKYVYQGIGLAGIWKLAYDDPRAYFLSCLIYKNAIDTHHIFTGTCKGTIIKPHDTPLAIASLPYTKIFIPTGSTRTLEQLRNTEEEKQYHHRFKAITSLITWLQQA